jgi:hypothetical protein
MVRLTNVVSQNTAAHRVRLLGGNEAEGVSAEITRQLISKEQSRPQFRIRIQRLQSAPASYDTTAVFQHFNTIEINFRLDCFTNCY